VDAPSFEGTLDPIKFLDWLSEIEDYFEWYGLEDDRRVGLAKIKLLGQARTYWKNQEHIFRQRPGQRTATWAEMKEKLKAKYLPVSFRQRMLDDWQNLKQGSKPVSDYIAKFDEFMSRCDIQEDEGMTLSRFRAGLRGELQRELILREIYTIHDAYEMVQNYESFSSQKRFEPNPRATTFQKPASSQTTPARVNSGFDKRKSVYRSDIECFNCHQYGHMKSQCPNPKRSLHIGSDDHQDNNEVEDIEGDHVLDGSCSDDDGQDHLNFIQDHQGEPNHRHPLSVVRCALSLPQ